MEQIDNRYEYTRKFHEYEMKIIKMAGYVSDHYLDEAIESDDFSTISSFLIDYFSGSAGKAFDVGYLYSKYKEFGLDEKVEDLDFNVEEWYKIKYEVDRPDFFLEKEVDVKMTEEEYLEFMINKRKREAEE
jgi:hypothetical protein